jgi:F-type H+-transporting ATPase subunit epsilon
MATTRFELVTPNRTLYSGWAEMIVCRSVDGEIAFLANHMPYIGALDAGLVRIVGPAPEGAEESTSEPDIRLAVQGGFVEVKDNHVIMLADVAELASEIDVVAAERDRSEAEQRVSSGGVEPDPELDTALRWAQARIEAATGAPVR